MRCLFALALLATVSGANASGGSRKLQPEFDRREVTVRLVYYPNPRALREAAPSGPQRFIGSARAEVKAWAEIDLTGGPCTIHVVDPAINYQPDVLGHEFAHCLFGRWHD